MYLNNFKKAELKEVIKSSGSRGLSNTLKFKHPKFLKYLKESYSFLDKPSNTQLAYHFMNELDEVQCCETCGSTVSFISFSDGYKRYCKGKCTLQ
jgi:hypothetical protein